MIAANKFVILLTRSLACGLLLYATSNAKDLNRFSVFANRPVAVNYDPIAKSSLSDLKQDWRNFQRNYKEWASLLKLVESGDALAVDLAIKLMPSTGGGNPGDLCRAV